jgi:hypothetical protein
MLALLVLAGACGGKACHVLAVRRVLAVLACF